ncbi:MAG: hypothetical protein OEM59_15200 [Rhodospirillales bacterium]|nr:hypothetical protein [Rhodospirillales bacterium]
MDFIYFTIVAVALYFFSNWLLVRVERGLGRPLEHRGLIFFGILLTAAVVTFALIRQFFGG